MAIKRTSDIIPMCHPLLITKSKCDIAPIARRGRRPRTCPRAGRRRVRTGRSAFTCWSRRA
ncbi:MAG: hypothetical protein ACLRM9_09700 [Collinsella aerofaciens]